MEEDFAKVDFRIKTGIKINMTKKKLKFYLLDIYMSRGVGRFTWVVYHEKGLMGEVKPRWKFFGGK